MINYVYIINKNFYVKYIKKELIINYLPIFYNENELEIINKIGMIYVKSIGFIGTINIINIIDESNENFDTLKLKYNLGTSTNLYFFEIKNISFLKKILKYRDYINYCKLKKTNYINFSKNDDLIISKNFSDFFDIENNNDYDNENISDEENEEDIEYEEINEPDENDDINCNKIIYKIPILWIPCINLTKLLEKKRLSKKRLKYHYNNCLNCENNNNNRNFQFNFDNYKNKINFINHFSILDYYNYYNDPTNINKYKIENVNENNNETEDDLTEDNETDEYNISDEESIIDEDDITRDKLIEKIITCYSMSINYSDTKENLNLIGIDDKMTNILYYNNINNDHIYNNTLFIIK